MLSIDISEYGFGSAGLIDESHSVVAAEGGLRLRDASEAELLEKASATSSSRLSSTLVYCPTEVAHIGAQPR